MGLIEVVSWVLGYFFRLLIGGRREDGIIYKDIGLIE